MLIILIILTVLAVIVGIYTERFDFEWISFISFIGAICIGFLDVIMIIGITNQFIEGYTASKKIEMYQEENKKIEKDIEIVVKNYMNYEKETYIEFKSESSITYVSLYPNLKSNELVKKQIDTYISNNAKIKELKEKEIDLKIGKWLLYFG